MERLGTFADARRKVSADTGRLLRSVRQAAVAEIHTVEAGVAVLEQLRAEVYENLNQIQHEFMIVRAAEWLLRCNRCAPTTVWFWNPRQTGPSNEPDLRGEYRGRVVLSAEITTSKDPKGLIDSRMRDTLKKLSVMTGDRFYFAASSAMSQRARTKVRKAGWEVEVVDLSSVASKL